MPGKRIQFHKEVLSALEELAGDRMATLQELADEAFDDLLKKHDRPVGIRAMLKGSRAKALAKIGVLDGLPSIAWKNIATIPEETGSLGDWNLPRLVVHL